MPFALAYSLIPLIELWLSAVRTSFVSGVKGYDSATNLAAPVALGVKMTTYSSGEAFR